MYQLMQRTRAGSSKQRSPSGSGDPGDPGDLGAFLRVKRATQHVAYCPKPKPGSIGFMVDLWWIYGGFMVDLWWIYGGFMVDLWWLENHFLLDLRILRPEKNGKNTGEDLPSAQPRVFQEKNRLEGFEGGNFPGIVDLKCSPAGEKGPHVAAAWQIRMTSRVFLFFRYRNGPHTYSYYIYICILYIVYLRYFQPKIVKNTGVRGDSAELTFKQIYCSDFLSWCPGELYVCDKGRTRIQKLGQVGAFKPSWDHLVIKGSLKLPRVLPRHRYQRVIG